MLWKILNKLGFEKLYLPELNYKTTYRGFLFLDGYNLIGKWYITVNEGGPLWLPSFFFSIPWDRLGFGEKFGKPLNQYGGLHLGSDFVGEEKPKFTYYLRIWHLRISGKGFSFPWVTWKLI